MSHTFRFWGALTVFAGQGLSAQYLSFDRTYGGGGLEGASDVIHASDGGYLLIGYTGSFGPAASDQALNAFLIKTNATGDVQWSRALGSTQREEFASGVVATNGDYLLVGSTSAVAFPGLSDILLSRFASNGVELWTKRIGTADLSEYGSRIVSNGADEYVLFGSQGVGGGALDGNILHIRINGEGEILETTSVDAVGQSDIKDALSDENGDFWLTGTLYDLPEYDLFLVKLSATGDLLQGQTFRLDGFKSSGRSLLLNENECVIYGTSNFAIGDTSALWFLRVDLAGGGIMNKRFRPMTTSFAGRLLRLPDGNIIATSRISDGYAAASANTLMHVGPDLTPMALIVGDTIGHSTGIPILADDGGIVIGGNKTVDMFSSDMSLSAVPFASSAPGPFCTSLDIAVNPLADLPITVAQPYAQTAPPVLTVVNLSWNAVDVQDIAAVECSNVGIPGSAGSSPQEVRCFPVPVADRLVVELPVGDRVVELSVTDVSCRVVIAPHKPAQQVVLDVSALSHGIYICKGLTTSGGHFAEAFVKE